MASYPTFDNRWFTADVPSDKFAELFPTKGPDGKALNPDLAALTNRAIQGQYNVGSTFKVFTAYAGPGDRAAVVRHRLQRRGHVRAEQRLGEEGRLRQRACAACSATRRARPTTRRASTAPSTCRRARRLQRRVLLPPRRGVLPDPRRAAAGPAEAVRVRIQDRHRPALRVRRPGADERAEAAARRQGRAGEGRGAEDAARRRAAPRHRPGPAGGDAAAVGRRLLGVRQRRHRRHAARGAGDPRPRDPRQRRSPASPTWPRPR